MRPVRTLSAAVAAVLLCGPVPAPAANAPAAIDTEPGDCLQIPPDRMPLTDAGGVLRAEVRVLVDARDLAIAKRAFATTTSAFRRIGINLRVTYDAVRNVPNLSGSTQHDLIAYARRRYKGKRPKGTDAVYFMTRYWAGGFADCIGGVSDPARAFAIGSVDYAVEGVVPAPTVDEGAIAAHELGHLFGAHHHYANCVEAQPGAGLRGEPGLCTTMAPIALTITSTFGTLEKLYIRSYARDYAKGM